jgi:hypothetical protein
VNDCKFIATQLTNTGAGRGDIAASNQSAFASNTDEYPKK